MDYIFEEGQTWKGFAFKNYYTCVKIVVMHPSEDKILVRHFREYDNGDVEEGVWSVTDSEKLKSWAQRFCCRRV